MLEKNNSSYYGDYVFYKMQLIHDTNRDLFLVLTRYGKIGETGMHQRTPFNRIEDAKAEFSKIFRTKSANSWDTALTEFAPKYGKYKIKYIYKKDEVKFDLKAFNIPEVDHYDKYFNILPLYQELDFENAPESTLNEDLVLFIRRISSIALFT